MFDIGIATVRGWGRLAKDTGNITPKIPRQKILFLLCGYHLIEYRK
jgi:hypothetical protein